MTNNESTSLDNFDVDDFLRKHRGDIIGRQLIVIGLLIAECIGIVALFRHFGIGATQIVFIGKGAFILLLIILGGVSPSLYKQVVSKMVDSISEIKSFGFAPKRFLWGKLLSFPNPDAAISHEDATMIKLGDTKVLTNEFEIYEYQQKGKDKKKVSLLCGEYTCCNNGQTLANEIMVVCDSIPARRPPIHCNLYEPSPKYSIYAQNQSDVRNSDLQYVRHIADNVYDHTKACPFIIYFSEGQIEVITTLHDLSAFSYTILQTRKLREDIGVLAKRLALAHRLADDTYVKATDTEPSTPTTPEYTFQQTTAIAPKTETKKEPEPTIKSEPKIEPEPQREPEPEAEPEPQKIAHADSEPLDVNFIDTRKEIIAQVNLLKYIGNNKRKINSVAIKKILSWALGIGLFAWAAYIAIKAWHLHDDALYAIPCCGIMYFPIIHILILATFSGKYSEILKEALKPLSNVTILDEVQTPMPWTSMLNIESEQPCSADTEDEIEISVKDQVINTMEFKLTYEKIISRKETETITTFTGVYMQMAMAEPFADNILVAHGNIKHQQKPAKYDDGIYGETMEDFEKSDMQRVLTITTVMAGYLKKNFIMCFSDGYIRLIFPHTTASFDFNGEDFSISEHLKSDVAAIAHRIQIARILAEDY